MKQVVDFLLALRENNNREWFTTHRKEYEVAKSEFEAFVERLIVGVEAFDEAIKGVKPRDCMYRINRDIRFSHNKEPYKTHFGAFISEGGKNGGLAGYYFHAEPSGDGMVGGNIMCAGTYSPQPKVMRSIREEMEFASAAFLMALQSAEKEGLTVDKDNVLSRVPMGFPKDSPMEEYLRLKDISVYRYFDNDMLLSPDLDKTVLRAFEASYPFVTMLNSAIRLTME
jgi:uncharacterized protein (TIGR02453 family)